jgi:hypothetical protein
MSARCHTENWTNRRPHLAQWLLEYPQANFNGFIPRYSFGGVPDPPNVSYDSRFLTGCIDFTFSFNDNVTITRGGHTYKPGVDLEVDPIVWTKFRPFLDGAAG